MIKTTKFNGSKLKSQLKMAVIHIQMESNRKLALSKQIKREIAMYLNEDTPKREKARLRTEAFIQDDNMIQVYDILKLQCVLLSERVKMIEQSKKVCPADLLSCVATLIYAEQFVDSKELSLIRKQFRDKYGKRFEELVLAKKENNVNEKIIELLSLSPRDPVVVQNYMIQICKHFEIDYTPDDIISQSSSSPLPLCLPVIYG